MDTNSGKSRNMDDVASKRTLIECSSWLLAVRRVPRVFEPSTINSQLTISSTCYGGAKPISIGSSGFSVLTMTALFAWTSINLYMRLPSEVAIGNS